MTHPPGTADDDPARRAKLLHSRLQIETACLLQMALAALDELGETMAAAHVSHGTEIFLASVCVE